VTGDLSQPQEKLGQGEVKTPKKQTLPRTRPKRVTVGRERKKETRKSKGGSVHKKKKGPIGKTEERGKGKREENRQGFRAKDHNEHRKGFLKKGKGHLKGKGKKKEDLVEDVLPWRPKRKQKKRGGGRTPRGLLPRGLGSCSWDGVGGSLVMGADGWAKEPPRVYRKLIPTEAPLSGPASVGQQRRCQPLKLPLGRLQKLIGTAIEARGEERKQHTTVKLWGTRCQWNSLSRKIL